MWKICRGELQNLANKPAKFGKILRGKLWFLIQSVYKLQVFYYIYLFIYIYYGSNKATIN